MPSGAKSFVRFVPQSDDAKFGPKSFANMIWWFSYFTNLNRQPGAGGSAPSAGVDGATKVAPFQFLDRVRHLLDSDKQIGAVRFFANGSHADPPRVALRSSDHDLAGLHPF